MFSLAGSALWAITSIVYALATFDKLELVLITVATSIIGYVAVHIGVDVLQSYRLDGQKDSAQPS